MNLAVSFVAKDTTSTFVQIFCDHVLLGEATVLESLSLTSSSFKIGDSFFGSMKLFKLFVSPMGSETFDHTTQSRLG